MAELELGRIDRALDRVAYRAAKARHRGEVQSSSDPVWGLPSWNRTCACAASARKGTPILRPE